MRFKIVKTLSLDFLGEGWSECYLNFSPLTYKDARVLSKMEFDPNDKKKAVEAGDEAVKLLKDHFLEGKALDDSGQAVEIKAADIEDMPVEVVSRALNFLSGLQADASKLS